MRWILFVLTLAGCTILPPPAPPASGASCSTAAATARKLGGCGHDVETFEGHCVDAQKAEAELGLMYPVECLTEATSCEGFDSCR